MCQTKLGGGADFTYSEVREGFGDFCTVHMIKDGLCCFQEKAWITDSDGSRVCIAAY